jgi:outer membrane protein TolC
MVVHGLYRAVGFLHLLHDDSQQQALSGEAELFNIGGGSEQMYNLGFNLSWEADVWRKFSRQVQSASAALDASVASYEGVMLSLISQAVATNLVEVYKSLGGGWQIRQGQDAPDLVPVETRDEMLERTGEWRKVFEESE